MLRVLLTGAAAFALAASPAAAQAAASAPAAVERAGAESDGLALTGGGPAVIATLVLALIVALIALSADDGEAISP